MTPTLFDDSKAAADIQYGGAETAGRALETAARDQLNRQQLFIVQTQNTG